MSDVQALAERPPEAGPAYSGSNPIDAVAELLETDPASAEAQARQRLAQSPDDPDALLVLAAALRHQGDCAAAIAILEPLAVRLVGSAFVRLELGLAWRQLGDHKKAIAILTQAVNLNNSLSDAWRAMGDEYLEIGDIVAADRAFGQHQNLSISEPQLQRAMTALRNGRPDVAEDLAVEFLEADPDNADAIKILAEVAVAEDREEDAKELLARCLELAPDFVGARFRYTTVLVQLNQPYPALAEIEILLKRDPNNPQFRSLKAHILAHLGKPAESLACFEGLVQQFPNHCAAWIQYAHSLKSAGRHDECIAAYRRAIELIPDLGGTYWSLANLKTFRFTEDDIQAMQRYLTKDDLSVDSRLHFHYSLGKAYEDLKQYEKSFDHYSKGAALRRSTADYDGEAVRNLVLLHKELFTPEFFAERKGWGCQARDPIFIVGLPRAGSTLMEQILSSHSMVEGTMELPEITSLARRLNLDNAATDEAGYPSNLYDLSAKECRSLGEEYMDSTRVQRHLGRPFFTDKMPNNFAHIPFIHLILPNAKIIDARRHPLACGFSNFKQHYSRGQVFTYSLTDIGWYYRSYVELMAYFDEVLPGKVHRVIYEEMVGNPDREIRRVLEFLELPFEESCLRFHETERSVRTASSEQVRQPMYKSAKEHWKNYEPWLGPLKETLGPVLDAYPDIPTFDDLPKPPRPGWAV
jgi:tetratricopeptide (TPR) repeat protein